MKSLAEIEAAIAGLPSKQQRQLVKDMPSLCPNAFPSDGWEGILRDASPRPALTALLDQLDAAYTQKPESFLLVNERSLQASKPRRKRKG